MLFDMSQLNLPHGTTIVVGSVFSVFCFSFFSTFYKEWKTDKLKKRTCSEVSVNSPGNLWSQSRRRKGRLWWEGLAEKEGFKLALRE